MIQDKKNWIALIIGVVLISIILIVVLVRGEDNKTQEPMEEIRQEEEEKYLIELEDGTKVNTSEELKNVKAYGNLRIGNIQFTEQNGRSKLTAEVKNTGNTTHEAEIVKIKIKGENNEIITEIKPVIGKIEPGETIKLSATITAEVANAKDIEIESME